MEREAAIRLLRALVAAGLRQRESMANAAIRSIAGQAELDEFDTAQQYARQQGWLVVSEKAFSTMLTSACWRVAGGIVSLAALEPDIDPLADDGARGASCPCPLQTVMAPAASRTRLEASNLGSNNTLTLTRGCTWLDMVGSNNTIIVALARARTLNSPDVT
jgi:hypothetical protein